MQMKGKPRASEGREPDSLWLRGTRRGPELWETAIRLFPRGKPYGLHLKGLGSLVQVEQD